VIGEPNSTEDNEASEAEILPAQLLFPSFPFVRSKLRPRQRQSGSDLPQFYRHELFSTEGNEENEAD
jgi:hypothetical protein